MNVGTLASAAEHPANTFVLICFLYENEHEGHLLNSSLYLRIHSPGKDERSNILQY